MPARQHLSATVITLNAAQQLAECLRSLAFADEVLVVDCGSTDGTIELARQHGARVIHQDWLGYGAQKQFAVQQAAHEWVLCVDADERITDALRESIEGALLSPSAQGFAMARCNRFMGRWLRHGEGYPDWSMRLFHRAHGRWSTHPVHEFVQANGPVLRLRGDLLHESAQSLTDYLSKQNRYTTLAAQQMFAQGERAGVLRLALSPLVRFFKFYLLRLGFLDGVAGLVHISIGCHNSLMKYAKLRALQQGEEIK